MKSEDFFSSAPAIRLDDPVRRLSRACGICPEAAAVLILALLGGASGRWDGARDAAGAVLSGAFSVVLADSPGPRMRRLADPHIHQPGHLLGLIGPRDCGKSLAQNLITHLAGGRSADASTWLQGRTDFNSQIWAAEHLILSDANLEDDVEFQQSEDGEHFFRNGEYPFRPKID